MWERRHNRTARCRENCSKQVRLTTFWSRRWLDILTNVKTTAQHQLSLWKLQQLLRESALSGRRLLLYVSTTSVGSVHSPIRFSCLFFTCLRGCLEPISTTRTYVKTKRTSARFGYFVRTTCIRFGSVRFGFLVFLAFFLRLAPISSPRTK